MACEKRHMTFFCTGAIIRTRQEIQCIRDFFLSKKKMGIEFFRFFGLGFWGTRLLCIVRELAGGMVCACGCWC